MLIQHCHLEARRLAYPALGRIEIAGDDPEEGGLAAPVTADNAPPFPPGDVQSDVLEDRAGAQYNTGQPRGEDNQGKTPFQMTFAQMSKRCAQA